MKRYFIYTAFFTLFLSTFTAYRSLVLKSAHITYLHFGFNLIESMVLAKIMITGEFFRLGERYGNKPLIYPTIYKTVIFTIFVALFSIAEHFLVGFFRHKSLTEIYQELLNKGLADTLAKAILMLFTFIFFFAILELDRKLGPGKLTALFFKIPRRSDDKE